MTNCDSCGRVVGKIKFIFEEYYVFLRQITFSFSTLGVANIEPKLNLCVDFSSSDFYFNFGEVGQNQENLEKYVDKVYTTKKCVNKVQMTVKCVDKVQTTENCVEKVQIGSLSLEGFFQRIVSTKYNNLLDNRFERNASTKYTIKNKIIFGGYHFGRRG